MDGFGTFILVFILFILFIIIIVTLPIIIGQWLAFKKAGKGGWEAIIPIYSQVVCCQIAGVNPIWVLIQLLTSVFVSQIDYIGPLLSGIVTIYFLVILNVSVARSFGKKDEYAVGLFFLPFVFWPLLASKKTQYVGPRPMKDAVLELVGLNKKEENQNYNGPVNNNQQTFTQQESTQDKFCTSCGTKLVPGQKFCTSCGNTTEANTDTNNFQPTSNSAESSQPIVNQNTTAPQPTTNVGQDNNQTINNDNKEIL